ncbi:MAG: EAL domain-containing response regulator [Deltaproteobacteria bacterium]|nr:MAG: EAL domain-containing response regulator [Deltaproteobacteria bacterium]
MNDSPILVLDDDPGTVSLVREIEEAGLRCVHVESAEAFWAAYETDPPCVVLLALVVGDIDGIEILAELGARRSRASIILCSEVGGRLLDAARRSGRAHRLNILGVLKKPLAASRVLGLLPEADAFGVRDATSVRRHPVWRPGPPDLDTALEHGEITVALQPKFRCDSVALDGFEALARWAHPLHGPVPPPVFVSLAERSGLIDRLTRRVLGLACGWIGEVDSQGPGVPSALHVAVNISARSLSDPAFLDRVSGVLGDAGTKPSRVVLELTETAAMEDPRASLDLLTRLRLRGFGLSIDDFGTGYSSMLQLVRLPFTELKVDRSFVATALGSAESRTVVRSIIDLGRSLGLTTTAEGVEDAPTMDLLGELGCDLAQGYHLGRPMSPEDARALAVRAGGVGHGA